MAFKKKSSPKKQMPKSAPKPKPKSPPPEKKPHPEAQGLLLLSISLIMILSLYSFKMGLVSVNWLGLLGYYLAFALTYLIGLPAFLVALYIGWRGWSLLSRKPIEDPKLHTFYFAVFAISSSILLNLAAENGFVFPSPLPDLVYSETVMLSFPYPHESARLSVGGVPLYYLYRDLPTTNLHLILSDIGTAITFSLTWIISLLLLTGIPVAETIKNAPPKLWQSLLWSFKRLTSAGNFVKNTTFIKPKEPEAPEIQPPKAKYFEPLYPPKAPEEPTPKMRSLSALSEIAQKKEKKKEPQELPITDVDLPKIEGSDYSSYQIPPSTLLRQPKKVDLTDLKKGLAQRALMLEETLKSFGIEAKVGDIHCGPTITSFEVHPSVGVKVQKIKALENDIALNMQAKSIRIIAPIPGKAAVGVEIPSAQVQEVSFREMLEGYLSSGKKLGVPVILGKTVSGENVVSDLMKMPHCIIAGATGSGKSVCINTIIMSILMTARPDEVKLLMVDPKKVELSAYTRLPHMIAPVITEPSGAYAALNWLVREMQKRYDMLKQIGLRNIQAFNTRKINAELEASLEIDVPEKMPVIIAIIDEFADLMMVSSADIETPIARIAQMARAVGIHLILATQRPSREVITGLIKANFPTRISFKVSSRINSQIVLDEMGAESLLGNGDMLFLPPGSSHLIRAQGAYINDEEINQVINYVQSQAPTNYLIKSFDSISEDDASLFSTSSAESGGKDTLFEQAAKLVIETKTASTTFLQRKLKIGYARAAGLMDELEEKGVVGPADGAKPRKVLGAAGAFSSIDTLDDSFQDLPPEL